MFSPIVSLIAGIFILVLGLVVLVTSYYPCKNQDNSDYFRRLYGVCLAAFFIGFGVVGITTYIRATPSATSTASTENITLASLENLRNLGLTEEEVKNVWFNCKGDKTTIFVANGTLYYASRGTLRVIPIPVNYDD